MAERQERITQCSETNILGRNIKRLRKERHLKAIAVIAQLQLRGIDINTGTFSKVENARNNPTVEMIIALKEIFDCNYEEFFINE